MKKMKIEKAIAMAEKKESLEGVVIEDMGSQQVKVKDALLLADYGIVVPEKNLYYDDNDISYDPEFDEVDWSDEPLKLSWEEKAKLYDEVPKEPLIDESVTMALDFSDKETLEWTRQNRDKISKIVTSIIENLYKTYKIIN